MCQYGLGPGGLAILRGERVYVRGGMVRGDQDVN